MARASEILSNEIKLEDYTKKEIDLIREALELMLKEYAKKGMHRGHGGDIEELQKLLVGFDENLSHFEQSRAAIATLSKLLEIVQKHLEKEKVELEKKRLLRQVKECFQRV